MILCIKKFLKLLIFFIVFAIILNALISLFEDIIPPTVMSITALVLLTPIASLIAFKKRRKNTALASSYLSTLLRSGGVIQKFAYSECGKHFIAESVITVIVALLFLVGGILPKSELNPILAFFISVLWTLVVVVPIIALNLGIWMLVCRYYYKDSE